MSASDQSSPPSLLSRDTRLSNFLQLEASHSIENVNEGGSEDAGGAQANGDDHHGLSTTLMKRASISSMASDSVSTTSSSSRRRSLELFEKSPSQTWVRKCK